MSKLLGTKTYQQIRLSADDIGHGIFKKFLGGGEEDWDLRGAFQLYLLREMGLEPRHRLLDAGCGPLRAGVHFIRYLDRGNYVGMDYNEDFISAAKHVIEGDRGLCAKEPTLFCVENFEFDVIERPVDYVLAFSVLNHGDPSRVATFLESLLSVTHAASRVFVSHAAWFNVSYLQKSSFVVRNMIDGPAGIAESLTMSDWGWKGRCGVFPIVELTLSDTDELKSPVR